ncbi:hypothetical protein [Oryzobacter terrae]|uniref:hypothetical protein n=1 Tax=Oryzobacter terrae TaxID=1620385 RepID=UPI00366BA6E4
MSHRRRVVTTLGCLGLLAATALPALPAQAAPVTATVTVDDAFMLLADEDNDLVAFANVTRAGFCTAEQVAAENAFLAWLVGGEVGDPPEFPLALADEPVTFFVHELGPGNLRATATTVVGVDLWTFEAGKSTTAGNLVAPCIDTDGLLDGTAVPIAAGTLFASGEGTWSMKDNDWEGAGPRANVWGDLLSARLSGPGGDYSYSIQLKNLARPQEYLRGASSYRLRPL